MWGFIMKGLVFQMNSRSLNCMDLCNIAYDINQIKMKSPKVFELILQYFEKMEFDA